jgi:hypothetical protein
MMRIYCEHSALSRRLKAHARAGRIELVYFPVDPNSRTKHIAPTATPSQVEWDDLNVSWDEGKCQKPCPWDNLKGSSLFAEILSVIGPQHRRDALHVDSAHKSGCPIFVTVDSDILGRRNQLQELLGIQFFHPDDDRDELNREICRNDGSA